MIFGKERIIRDEILLLGKKLYDLRLVTARSGNLSARLDDSHVLVTATGTSLGALHGEDIIKVDLSDEADMKNSRLTSEFPLHSLVYKNFPARVVIHCHPALVNAYFSVYSEIKALTFETRLFVGNVPVVAQDTPNITKPELVIDALKNSNIIVVKNHGVVSVGEKFIEALYLIEMLEEAVKTASVARLFKKDILDGIDTELKASLSADKTHLIFSREHIQAIVDLVNKDEFIARKGAELDLTLKLAITMSGSDTSYKFNFEKGRITKLEFDDDAPFVISAPIDIWEAVFLGKIEPFVATTQGKMKLKGEIGKLSRWFVPFSRLFEIFKQVKIK
ncbi:MAG: class II aldolase/adducin family protein [Candidatus Omnitrophica bacterium]|nr:class II aldolase/adducin family protein [Candidatus Omnitrophota bacterium]